MGSILKNSSFPVTDEVIFTGLVRELNDFPLYLLILWLIIYICGDF